MLAALTAEEWTAGVPAGLTAEEWTAIGTVAAAVILAITLGLVLWQVIEARRMRRERFRPWVTVSFHFRSDHAFISVKNIGTTAARDFRIRFEPELATTRAQGIGEIAMLSEPTPVLAPGEERLILLDRVSDRLNSALPTRHTAHVEYRDHRGDPLRPDQFVLDFGLLGGTRLPDKGMHDLVEEIERLRTELGKAS